VVHASLIHSEREIFFTSHDLSIAAVSVSSIVTEYRTILDRFAGARNEYFDHLVHQRDDILLPLTALFIMNSTFSLPAMRKILVKNCGAATTYCKVIVPIKRMSEYFLISPILKKSISNYPEVRDFFKMPVAGYDLTIIAKGDGSNYFIEITDGITRYE